MARFLPVNIVPALAFISSLRYEDIGSIRAIGSALGLLDTFLELQLIL